MFRPALRTSVPPLFLLTVALCTAPAAAQSTAKARSAVPPLGPGELYRQVFGAGAKVTGKNGYEDLVLAVEALRATTLFAQADARAEELTLEERRRVVKDRAVQRALTLTRMAVGKPVASPRTTLTFGAKLPELTGFRSLGRLLATMQYVQLAEGRTSEAIGTARLCLQVGRLVQTDTLQSTLAGMNMQGTCIRSLAPHLDQLSAADCARLFDVCREWLAQPPPSSSPNLGKAELASADQFIATLRAAGAEKAPEVLRRELGLSASETQQVQAYLSLLSPMELDRMVTRVSEDLHTYHTRALEELKKPAWQRNRTVLRPDASSPLAVFLGQAGTSLDRISDRFTREGAQIRLLACHTAILRYRWEQNALPPNLDTLNLGDLAIDPFTGQPFKYRPGKRQYQLSSAGVPAETDDPRAVEGRRPIKITPDE